MDILETSRIYIKEMVALAGPQMKVFLMDKDTTGIVSCAYAQSEMMQKEVYLFERIDSPAPREQIKHLKCLVFLRPTPDNIQLLSEELRNPKYAQYYIYFSNIINKTDVKRLAESDEQETVREVHEFFVDGISLSRQLFSLGLKKVYEPMLRMSTQSFMRCRQGLISLILALKKKPTVCYQRSNEDCDRLADEVHQVIRREEALFRESKEDTLLIIIDRSEDPVTPLLNQWTYEAMVHELIGINNNRVAIDGNNVVLSELHDEFYAKNVISNFGEIGQNIKALMEEYQNKSQINKNVESIADMKNFVEEYPQFKKMTGTVSTHVSVVGELSKIVAGQNLLEISELEQSIVAEGDHSRCLERIRAFLQHQKTSRLNAIRLVLLYALRFETNLNNDLGGLVNQLRSKEPGAANLVRSLLRFAGDARRTNDLFGNQSAVAMTKRFIKGLKGVENVYTQHETYLSRLLEQCCRGRLNEQNYPRHQGTPFGNRIDNIIFFIVGGATYEEVALIRQANEKRRTVGGPAVLLASTHMLNTQSFLEQLECIGSGSR